MRHLITTVCLLLCGLAVAACSGSDAINLGQKGQIQSNPQSDAGGSITAGATLGQKLAETRVHFAAAVGTPAEALPPLEDGLNERARERGLAVETAENATLVVNGYFSTVAEDGGTLIIYVWDVTDKAGNRLHRLQGQHKVSTTSGGWEAVKPETIKRIGERTIDELVDWIGRSNA